MGNIFGILIVRPFGMILAAIYKAVGSYGLAVILFAVLAKVLLFPLAYKNKQSMKKMSALSAKQQELQKKYAKNRCSDHSSFKNCILSNNKQKRIFPDILIITETNI